MIEIEKFFETGLMELYILGETNAEESELVEKMVELHPKVQAELKALEVGLEQYAISQSASVDPKIKPFLLATVDFMDRLQQGEVPIQPPTLGTASKISDYDPWLKRPDLDLAPPATGIQAKIISANPGFTMAIVWLREGSPIETHTNELESFLIVEGSCNIIIDGQDHHLGIGDMLTIPLFLPHEVLITSKETCKLILQRIAA